MAQAAEKILSTLAPHLRTVGVALRGARVLRIFSAACAMI